MRKNILMHYINEKMRKMCSKIGFTFLYFFFSFDIFLEILTYILAVILFPFSVCFQIGLWVQTRRSWRPAARQVMTVPRTCHQASHTPTPMPSTFGIRTMWSSPSLRSTAPRTALFWLPSHLFLTSSPLLPLTVCSTALHCPKLIQGKTRAQLRPHKRPTSFLHPKLQDIAPLSHTYHSMRGEMGLIKFELYRTRAHTRL